MAFKRSAVRSRLSPPTRESEKRLETTVLSLFCSEKYKNEEFSILLRSLRIGLIYATITS